MAPQQLPRLGGQGLDSTGLCDALAVDLEKTVFASYLHNFIRPTFRGCTCALVLPLRRFESIEL